MFLRKKAMINQKIKDLRRQGRSIEEIYEFTKEFIIPEEQEEDSHR